MSPKTTQLKISRSMDLEQAMAEVRSYLESKRNPLASQLDMGSGSDSYLSMQGAFIARLAEISGRLEQVEPNSKAGAAGVFLKRAVKKLIGFYSRPVHEFQRTSLQNFQQIRQDMLRLQAEISTLPQPLAEARPAGAEPGKEAGDFSSQGNDLDRSTLELFQGLLAVPSIRQVLQAEKPELLRRIEELLTPAQETPGGETLPGDAPRPGRM